MPKWVKGGTITIIALCVISFIWEKATQHHNISQHKATNLVIDEDKKVCSTAWQQEQAHANDHRKEDIPFFDVILTTDECFGGDVWRPDSWHHWEKEFVSSEPDAHVSFWFHGWDPRGPYFRNKLPEFNYPPSREFRLKGKGTIRYFRTD